MRLNVYDNGLGLGFQHYDEHIQNKTRYIPAYILSCLYLCVPHIVIVIG